MSRMSARTSLTRAAQRRCRTDFTTSCASHGTKQLHKLLCTQIDWAMHRVRAKQCKSHVRRTCSIDTDQTLVLVIEGLGTAKYIACNDTGNHAKDHLHSEKRQDSFDQTSRNHPSTPRTLEGVCLLRCSIVQAPDHGMFDGSNKLEA